MKIVHGKPLPRAWQRHQKACGILLESDIAPSNHSRLMLKLLVFDTRANMRHFWNHVMANSRLGFGVCGAVNALAFEVVGLRKDGSETKPVTQVDPRYFAIMGLCVRDLCFEVICHESIHAGFAYAKRVNKRNGFARKFDFDEEHVCYPAGRIAASINRLLFRHRLYERSLKISPASK